MNIKYDGSFARVHAEGAKVAFSECKPGYLREVEGPDYGGSLEWKSWAREGEDGEL